MTKNYKLVLSGSGTRYPCFIGALERLLEEDVQIEEICGTSGGGLVASGLAWKYDKENPLETIKFLKQMALNLMPGTLLDPHWFDFALSFKWKNLFHGYGFKPQNLFSKHKPVFTLDPKRMVLTRNTNGIFRGAKILDELKRNFSKELQLKIPVTIVTYNNNLKQANFWKMKDEVDGNLLSRLVRATISLPMIFDPVLIGEDIHTDGGATANFPLDVFGKDAQVIGLTFELDTERVAVEDKIDIASAHIDGMITTAMKEDEEGAGSNARVCRIKTRHAGLNLRMTSKDVAEQIKEGYDSMSKWLETNDL